MEAGTTRRPPPAVSCAAAALLPPLLGHLRARGELASKMWRREAIALMVAQEAATDVERSSRGRSAAGSSV